MLSASLNKTFFSLSWASWDFRLNLLVWPQLLYKLFDLAVGLVSGSDPSCWVADGFDPNK